jgi:hypothetical protein
MDADNVLEKNVAKAEIISSIETAVTDVLTKNAVRVVFQEMT